jgi:hypothetical protein
MNAWTAVLPLIGVVVGALLTHWFSRAAEARKQLELLRNQAYVDYLRAVAKAAHGRTPEALRSVLAEAADAKARIAVYGATPVVAALARFEEAGPRLDNARSNTCFIALASAMRAEADDATPHDLRWILIGPERASSEEMQDRVRQI